MSWVFRILRSIGRIVVLLVLVMGGAAVLLVANGWYAFGQRPGTALLERIERSPQWADGRFHNRYPLYNNTVGAVRRASEGSPVTVPVETPAYVATDPDTFAAPPESDLRVSWLGHSIVLIEMEGATVLTDPVWAERVSPYTWAGPKRWYPPTIALDDLPPIDAVLISHDHYDHLDTETIEALAERVPQFIVPLGVGAHLAYWGVQESRIEELDWWDEIRIGEIRVVATPARHASGRWLVDNDRTLWVGFALLGRKHRLYFSGDTGLFPGMREIGDRLGPFDVTLIEVGAYGPDWPDWHIGPEQAVLAHNWVRGDVLLPVHWGLFDLALHAWTEPIERVLVAAEAMDYRVLTPRPGLPIEPMAATAMPVSSQSGRWWPAVPWRTAQEVPIVATGDFDRSPRPRPRPRPNREPVSDLAP